MATGQAAVFGPTPLGGTFTATTGLLTPDVSAASPLEPIQLSMSFTARADLAIPAPTNPVPQRRITPIVAVTVPTPAVVDGVPVLPRFWGRMASSSSVQQGIGHTRSFPDPDPVWNAGTSSWDVPPPDGPTGMIRWTVRDLPAPFTVDGINGEYPLGTASSVDGTSGQPSATRQWNSSAGSAISVPFKSAYPFKPLVRAHVHYGTWGQTFSITQAVHLNRADVAHMWADMGSFLTPPYTLLVVAIVMDFPSRKYLHTIFDSGYDPTPQLPAATRAKWLAKGVPDDYTLSGEDYPYRTGLRVGLRTEYGFTDPKPTTRMARASFADTHKPKMFFLIDRGAKSAVGNYSTSGRHKNTVSFANHGAHRFLVLGRKNGVLSPDYASHLAVFEIRAFNDALTDDQLAKQYKQLSSTWRFTEYV